MKESLGRITTWVRAHPWLAALILGAVILLGYIVYKRSGGGGGGSNSGGAVSDVPASDSPFQSGIPDLGSISSPITSGGLSSVPSSETEVSSTTGFSSGGKEKPVGVAPSGNLGNFGSDTWAPDFSASVAALTQPVTQALPSSSGSSMSQSPIGSRGVIATDLKKGDLKANVKKNNPLSQKVAANTKGKTPAQVLGKGRLFTGYINGVYYVNGFPVGSSPISGAVTMPGGRTASKQILGIN